MTKNYENGKIYRIVGANGNQYIGSTTETLSKRLARHRKYHKYPRNHGVTSLLILKDDPDAKIILIENYPCQNSEELRAREQYWIEHIEGGCVNKVRAYRPPEVVKELAKEYREKNYEKIKQYKHDYFAKIYEPEYYSRLIKLFKEPDEIEEEEQQRRKKKQEADRQYREHHKEERSEKWKDYYQDEEIKKVYRERSKKWYEENKEKAVEQRKKWYEENKEKHSKLGKQWYEENKEKVKERSKKWYEDNKELATARRKEYYEKNKEKNQMKVKCECGDEVRRDYLKKHRQSKKHQDNIKT